MSDSVLHLISRGYELPQGWGFPVDPGNRRAPSGVADAVALREALLPLTDPEGLPQLVRWHHTLLQSRPHIWRSIASDRESYRPGDVYKPLFEAPGIFFTADPDGGYLTLGWEWAGETSALLATATLVSSRRLNLQFGDRLLELVHAREGADIYRIGWPAWLRCRAAVKAHSSAWVPGLTFQLALRVKGFNPDYLLSRIGVDHQATLQRAGLLDSFLTAVSPLDKLAVVWLAIAALEPAPEAADAVLAPDI